MACGGRHKQGDKKEEGKEKTGGVELVLAGKILPELEEGFGGF